MNNHSLKSRHEYKKISLLRAVIKESKEGDLIVSVNSLSNPFEKIEALKKVFDDTKDEASKKKNKDELQESGFLKLINKSKEFFRFVASSITEGDGGDKTIRELLGGTAPKTSKELEAETGQFGEKTNQLLERYKSESNKEPVKVELKDLKKEIEQRISDYNSQIEKIKPTPGSSVEAYDISVKALEALVKKINETIFNATELNQKLIELINQTIKKIDEISVEGVEKNLSSVLSGIGNLKVENNTIKLTLNPFAE